MTGIVDLFERVRGIVDLGGPVVALLALLSVLATTVILFKIWQFQRAGVGKRADLGEAVAARDDGRISDATRALSESPSYLAPILRQVVEADAPLSPEAQTRARAQIDAALSRLEAGFRFLDSIAQIAPLLGLFGTVLGMIEAFQALQSAGSQVDPSVLAGGIWVALLTTAAGLAVAMPTSLLLAWLEGRTEAERVAAEAYLSALIAPGLQPGVDATPAMAHAT
ncbi:MotA/TolQ/ExbB proton channel family protein [Aestuariibius sp. 2305UL40-4]|uniref:MotA/TolQ/ExbB proton channel family protein n=1 Tax=Aestuariibius violaceus TaxID=3234132 RepID=UPI00345E5AE0